jgi:hypothetical protein
MAWVVSAVQSNVLKTVLPIVQGLSFKKRNHRPH